MGLIECTLQPGVVISNHFEIKMESHDLTDMKALLKCSFGITTFVLFIPLNELDCFQNETTPTPPEKDNLHGFGDKK